MNLTDLHEEAAEAAFKGYEWPADEPATALGWSASDCGERLVRPVLIDAEIGRFEVAFEPASADVTCAAAWLNGEQIGQCPGTSQARP